MTKTDNTVMCKNTVVTKANYTYTVSKMLGEINTLFVLCIHIVNVKYVFNGIVVIIFIFLKHCYKKL